jgi:hypothetical protein
MRKAMESAKRCPREVNLMGKTRILLGSCSNTTLDQRFGVEKLGFHFGELRSAWNVLEAQFDWLGKRVFHLGSWGYI